MFAMRKIPIVIVCVLVLAYLGLPSGLSAADSSAYRLAYISYSDNQIWTVNPDGTDAQQITRDGADKQGLVASPDGRYLAYYTQIRPDNTNSLTYQVVTVLNLATGEQRLITAQEVVTNLTWSPDSQQLLFAILTHHEDFSISYQLFVINRDGSGRTQLDARDSAGTGFGWSPDGKHILFSSQNTDSGYQIFMLDADGSNAHTIIHFDNCFICTAPEWTADGQSIVFFKHPDLFIMDADGQHLRQLTDFVPVYNVVDVAYARYGAPSFSLSVDGQSLYYTMGYPIQIVKMDLTADGWAKRTVLYDDQTHIIGGNLLSPDGKLIFFTADSPQGNLLSSLDVDTHEVHVLATNVSEPVILSAT